MVFWHAMIGLCNSRHSYSQQEMSGNNNGVKSRKARWVTPAAALCQIRQSKGKPL
ncbi:hypothetical protein ANACOL_02313 [Anaerotruncus colihominis DSM 17241]|uniref:Uncharacterized protein n=1 Tax=Anaerotruncus colihominis DSM 17241 TaxID=445972 RepID=B0PC04_9FIRM|nr:hypothetical protein ANACOL_02313 [Anaerotruncus colihominis DSM 17241]